MKEKLDVLKQYLLNGIAYLREKGNKVKGQWKNAHLYTRIGIALLLAGVILASFPYFHNLYYQYQQQRQLEAQLAEMEQPSEKNVSQAFRTKEDYQEDPTMKIESSQEDEKEEMRPGTFEPDTGILEIPTLDLQQKIGYGVELPDLEDGPGFYPESQKPEYGNVSIAGHRTTYGAPFRYLNELENGDLIKLYYKDEVYHYKVAEVFDTHSKDWSVVDPTSEPALTLTTCHPPGSDERRLIVRAYLDETEN